MKEFVVEFVGCNKTVMLLKFGCNRNQWKLAFVLYNNLRPAKMPYDLFLLTPRHGFNIVRISVIQQVTSEN